MTTDEKGYHYEYDYENRVVAIRDSSSVTVANFVYDALGRRILKYDVAANVSTLYYNNYNWQVLLETQGGGQSDVDKRYFVCGNYIDEVLMMVAKGATRGRRRIDMAQQNPCAGPSGLFLSSPFVFRRAYAPGQELSALAGLMVGDGACSWSGVLAEGCV